MTAALIFLFSFLTEVANLYDLQMMMNTTGSLKHVGKAGMSMLDLRSQLLNCFVLYIIIMTSHFYVQIDHIL